MTSPATMAMNLELCHGRHGASARVELHDRRDGLIGLVSLRGWIDRVALRRLQRTLDDLAGRDLSLLLVDCSQLRHIDFRLVSGLLQSLGRFDPERCRVCGLSRHLRDLFRLAGCDRDLSAWPSADELLASPRGPERSREWAS